MKKLFVFCSVCMLMLVMPMEIHAQHTEIISTEVIPQEDGGTLEITLEQQSSLTRASNTKSGSKTVSKKNANGVVLWSATLTGTFTYDGSKATCTSSKINVSISASTWKVSNKSASKSGNKAIGTFVMKQYLQSEVIAETPYTVTITCSPAGKLS